MVEYLYVVKFWICDEQVVFEIDGEVVGIVWFV